MTRQKGVTRCGFCLAEEMRCYREAAASLRDRFLHVSNHRILTENSSETTRGIDPDAHLTPPQRATALLVQRTLEEHYAFIILYTHFIRDAGWQHARAAFNKVPAPIRPLVSRMVRGRMRNILWVQGISRHADGDILKARIDDWRAVFSAMPANPFFFGEAPTSTDAIIFGALAPTIFTPIQSSGFPEIASGLCRLCGANAGALLSTIFRCLFARESASRIKRLLDLHRCLFSPHSRREANLPLG